MTYLLAFGYSWLPYLRSSSSEKSIDITERRFFGALVLYCILNCTYQKTVHPLKQRFAWRRTKPDSVFYWRMQKLLMTPKRLCQLAEGNMKISSKQQHAELVRWFLFATTTTTISTTTSKMIMIIILITIIVAMVMIILIILVTIIENGPYS